MAFSDKFPFSDEFPFSDKSRKKLDFNLFARKLELFSRKSRLKAPKYRTAKIRLQTQGRVSLFWPRERMRGDSHGILSGSPLQKNDEKTDVKDLVSKTFLFLRRKKYGSPRKIPLRNHQAISRTAIHMAAATENSTIPKGEESTPSSRRDYCDGPPSSLRSASTAPTENVTGSARGHGSATPFHKDGSAHEKPRGAWRAPEKNGEGDSSAHTTWACRLR